MGKREKGRVGIPVTVVTVLVYVFLLLPLVVVILASFSPTPVLKFPPDEISFKWYANIFSTSGKFVSGFVNSIVIAMVATVIDVFLGVTACLSVSKYDFKFKNVLVNFYTSPMFIPSITFAFVLLQLFTGIKGMPAWAKILIGHVVIILPYIVRNTLAILSSFDWTLEDAAASLGAGPVTTFFKVTLPVIKPGVMAGALLAFLYSFDEAVISSFLTNARFSTLPIRILNYMEFSFDPTIAAISTILILGSLTLMLIMESVVGLDMFLKT